MENVTKPIPKKWLIVAGALVFVAIAETIKLLAFEGGLSDAIAGLAACFAMVVLFVSPWRVA